MNYYLGLDVGSVNVKLCLVDDKGSVVKHDIEKIVFDARQSVNSLLKRLEQFPDIAGAGVTGSGKELIPADWHWGSYSSPLAVASGVLHAHPDARTIIQVGGQTSLVISLEDGLKKPWKVVSNPLCAAGTGRFLEQQAYRLGITMEDFTRIALSQRGHAPRVAARCSVFAKSDIIHLQQKGVQLSAILSALCESIARMIVSLKKGPFDAPLYLVGGVAANGAVERALNALLSSRNGYDVAVAVPGDAVYTEAHGAALLSIGRRSKIGTLPVADNRRNYFQTPPLERQAVPVPPSLPVITDRGSGYLGIDVGSTSTKAVILDSVTGKIIAKTYLMTAGRPIDAVKQVMVELMKKGAENVDIAGAGVTGSGRYLVGGFVGADLIKNEITAQTRAAAVIDQDADIIEIGGQDSKLVLKRNGVVIDCQMNKACAAGTGSFIDELADQLGVKVTNGDFARLAFTAPYTIDLGTRCAAFMSQSITSAQQDGVSLPVITASLANAIAKNYLSKVVAHRKLGRNIILTGAVFYNEAVVAAFRQQLPDHELSVAEHREVSGAAGAALLARDQGRLFPVPSVFKGFKALAESSCHLTTFPCYHCDNNCSITQMKLPDGSDSFFGSRCDRYDSRIDKVKIRTAFDDREALLLKDAGGATGHGPAVGIPRALLTHDLAPLLTGFLNALDARVVISPRTTAKIIEHAIELSYTDSCFPVKLLHGHVAFLKDAVDFILCPAAIRLGPKEGDENQKYACPLVQASPFIVREVLETGARLVSPVIDFSLGDDEVIANLARTARELGAPPVRARQAAVAGIRSQRLFETGRAAAGREVLASLKSSGKTGVVLISRSYMAGDPGANLGIANALAQLGVEPIPMDFLPLESVDISRYTDRPYWSYESKFIAASDIIAREPNLYGLMITNFGCGPNSFILPVLEDIMGGKPLGQLEVDEHAAEAGVITRLEAFVDTINGYSRTAQRHETAPIDYKRQTLPVSVDHKTFVIPFMAPFIRVLAGAVEASGRKVEVLPETDARSLQLSNRVTAGTECLPYRATLGDFLRFCEDNRAAVPGSEFIMASAYGPCRLGKYALEQGIALKQAGYDIQVRSTTSNKSYEDLNLGADFPRRAADAIFAADALEKLLWRARPYEKESGLADRLFESYVSRFRDGARRWQNLNGLLEHAARDFKEIIDVTLPRRPLVGINGEIYLRANRFANDDLARCCEAAGLEVTISPTAEWLRYIFHRAHEDNFRFRRYGKLFRSYLRRRVLDADYRNSIGVIEHIVGGLREGSIEEVLAKSGLHLSPRCGSEAVLSIGSGLEWLESPDFAGVISVMPHGCMPGGIVAAMAEKLASSLHKPWVTLTYDGIMESNNRTRIQNFAEIIRYSASSISPQM
ncbi:CoA-substrate-specific enzyme activase, putative [Dehalogenimonas formicexedens]|uniref:CoA-substrate-specific enzyme activase, putative n=1 Tax=Dehalogenimonas formicexedens TaxID=1839801 RepID=A0A1P8F9W8_9CHLR|nr:acyl-CoA dehydratase activase [Dehalogenimonas formicexedens]APV45242.1 CoA-substrate-specific enzyme activase, putative [Dehalogenimonas formicexedens]